MSAANRNAEIVAQFLSEHPRVAKVHHLAYLPEGSAARRVYEAQCEAPGSTFSFDVKGGEAEAFKVLNALQVFKLAVSLGGTESLTCHPASTTHSGVPEGNPRPPRRHATRRSGSRSASSTRTISWRISARPWPRWGDGKAPFRSGPADTVVPISRPSSPDGAHPLVLLGRAERDLEDRVPLRAPFSAWGCVFANRSRTLSRNEGTAWPHRSRPTPTRS